MDILISILSLLGFVVLTASTGLFVAIEFALTGVERSTVDNHVKERGDASAHAVQRDFRNLSFVLSGAQLGITVTTLATGFLAEPILAQYFTPLLEWLGLPEGSSSTVALVLAMIVATVLSMVFGELVPKNLAITMPLPVARFVVHPVHVFNTAFKWFINFLNVAANWTVRKMGIEPADELASARSPQELGSLVRNSVGVGGIDAATAEVLEASLKFGETTAEDLMTPRSTVDLLQAEETIHHLIALSLDTGHSRFPVVNGDLDETLGVVHVKDAFSVPAERRNQVTVGSIARKIPAIPESLGGDAVLKAVRSAGSQMVLVADEYGGTAGIITIEDVVEEILGDVYDEHDDQVAERDFQRFGTNWEVAGLVRTAELFEEIGYQAPEGPYETLGGLIMAQMGRIPAVGDVVLLPGEDRWIARVSGMDDRRIDRVILTPVTEEEAKEYQQ
ncbi:hemolysin family protein [Corynebacterium sp. 21KM1197]|uniref:hemolysin family protein n=1 Tax=Corynebacterium sp. 21KM1197 TaxID=2989734 RepID=UPI0029CA5A89|nr:hemolysin family protein [Corynebacterium sp. 21KM1197]WPF69640.1 hemolysin family protein [Corynebacterium sp. 21KM1197]